MRKNTDFKSNQQQGSVLLIALMILVVLTLLTFSSSKTVLLQQKMTASSKDNILALEVAQSALAEAENAIFSFDDNSFSALGSSAGVYDGLGCGEIGKDQHCTYVSKLNDLYKDSIWTKSTEATREVSCGNPDDSCKLKGKYIIVRLKEFSMGAEKDPDLGMGIHSNVVEVNELDSGELSGGSTKMYLYKVIARGSGRNTNSSRIVVSYYAARASKIN